MTVPARRHNGLIVREWLILTLLAACVASAAEIYLIDQSTGLVTGGFLADGHFATVFSRLGFVAVSILCDATILGLIVAFVLWVCARLQLRPAGRILYTLGFALLPVAWFDFVTYQIQQYIGDVFNLDVLFELSGRSIPEFLAVAGWEIALLIALLVGGGAAILAVAWLLNRLAPLIEGDTQARWSRGRVVARVTVALLLLGSVGSTIARLSDELVDRGLARKATGTVIGHLVQFLTDVDRDGYGLLSRPRDSAPFDSGVHPYAVDIPGNGIDENGVGGDLPVAYASYEAGPSTPPAFAERPPVVFVILETFRADLLFRTRAGREVTPFLNYLARQGSYTDRAYSHNGWTQQSRYHLFTGTLAGSRGRTSLIDDFNANGYDTAFFSAQDESHAGHIDVGFRRSTISYDAQQDAGHRYSTSTLPGNIAVPHTLLERRVVEYLERRSNQRPLFLHLNFQETHFPYGHKNLAPLVSKVFLDRREIVPSRRDDLRAMYDNAAANVDDAIRRTVEQVRLHTGAVPLVVAIADHGESLFDDDRLGHGLALSDAETRIVLIVSRPGIEIPAPIGQSDVRDLVWRVMMGEAAAPVHIRRVFQYTGDVRLARRIAWVKEDGTRLVLDLHSRDKVATADATELLHFWEALLLAGAPRPGQPVH